MIIVKEITFEAAHYLKNTGKCSNLHGHSYKLQVEVEGSVSNGMVMNFTELKKVLESVHEEFDHKCTNDLDVSGYAGLNMVEYPTAENMTMYMWNRIQDLLPSGVNLHCIRLWETATSYVEYRWK